MALSWLKDYNLLIFDQIDSTNSEAIRLAKAGVVGNFVIWANRQLEGRGQRGRAWQSLEGNLHASILLDLPEALESWRLPQLSFIISNCLYETISFFAKRQSIKLDIALKWPNDVLINKHKVAGILLESINIFNSKYVVIGVGVNILKRPVSIEKLTTSLNETGLGLTSSHNFLNVLMNKFSKALKQWQQGQDFTFTEKKWLSRAFNLNKVITVDNGTQRMSGIFKGIDIDGSIILELASGQLCNLSVGEIISDA